MREGRKLRCVIPGGSSTPVLTPDQLDFDLDFDSILKVGSMLGSAGTIVIDDSACMVWVARKLAYFYKHESCGKCSPCREGTGWLLRLLDKIEEGQGTARDLEILSTVCDSIMGKTVCAFGDAAATPPLSTLAKFRDEYEYHVREKGCWRRVAKTFEEAQGEVGQRPAGGGDMTLTPMQQELAISTVLVLFLFQALLGLFSLMTYVERRVLAFMQFRLGPNRTGPFGILQPVADGIKLFFKEEVIPEGANKLLFVAAPAIAIVTAFLAIAVVPYGGSVTFPHWGWLPDWLEGRRILLQIADLDVGVLFLFAVSSLGVYAIVMAGWAANNKYTLIGGLRSSAQMFSYELALGPQLRHPDHGRGLVPDPRHRGLPGRLVLALERRPAAPRLPGLPGRHHGRGEPHAVRPAGGGDGAGGGLPHRIFVDAVRAHPDGGVRQHDHRLRHGGEPVPGRLALRDRRRARLALWFVGKMLAFLFLFIWLRGTVPRFRYDQLMHFGWKVLVPLAMAWIFVAAALILVRQS